MEAIGKLDRTTQTKASFKLAGRILDRLFFEEVRRHSSQLENVELIEGLEHDEALSLLSAAHAFICPSRDETMPISVIEAASLGKVIISADVGGIGEWIHDELNGLLASPENPQALADAIARCARDRSFARQLGLAARRTFQRHFTIDRRWRDHDRSSWPHSYLQSRLRRDDGLVVGRSNRAAIKGRL